MKNRINNLITVLEVLFTNKNRFQTLSYVTLE